MLVLLSEQAAVPLDQLARFLCGSKGDAVVAVGRLEALGYLEHYRFLAGQDPWFWLSPDGVERAGTGFRYGRPEVAMLAHRRAVNEVRLHLRECAPQGEWICERAIFAECRGEQHLPDAVLKIGGERHAIEAELSRKRKHEIRAILAHHSARYDAVIYFCARYPYNLLTQVKAEGRWPKLIVRRLPKGRSC